MQLLIRYKAIFSATIAGVTIEGLTDLLFMTSLTPRKSHVLILELFILKFK